MSQATAYRYLHEAIDVLAGQAPDLHQALQRAVADGLSHLVLDGKIFDSDRCRLTITSVKGETIDEWYSGKTGDFGGNVQALSEPSGLPIWTSDVEPGGIADIQAARTHVLPPLYPYANTLPILADPGYQGAGHGVTVPFKNPTDGNILATGNRTHNALQRSLRCLGEHDFALLTQRWTAPSTPPSAPAESATSSAPPTSSPFSSTAGSTESQRENLNGPAAGQGGGPLNWQALSVLPVRQHRRSARLAHACEVECT
ncbi:transposase family protein [Actinomadura darangshiensis]|uniref:transposase family protein n=1 Tax=Actinomadura darangshiensis TaxID=705336 RepID=UPI00140863F3|nr:transposase family protein [Actinomadura darangshiensis]